MDEIQFSAADIRVFLAEHLPYYEAEDKDDFLYIAKASDIEKVALELYRHLTSRRSRAARCYPEQPEHIFDQHGFCCVCGTSKLPPA